MLTWTMTKPPTSGARAHPNGYESVMPSFECELLLRENDHQSSRPHSFVDEVRPGTIVRIDEHDWVVTEIRGGSNGAPREVICRPVYERL
jgi:hypothetical protein